MPFPSGPPYDTEPYQARIAFYRVHAGYIREELTSTNAGNVTMQTAKRRATSEARAYGLKPDTRQWIPTKHGSAYRMYRDDKGNIVKVVIRRS